MPTNGFPAVWPADTAFLQYNGLGSLISTISMLHSLGHVFVVHPESRQIAMSEQAARAIGIL